MDKIYNKSLGSVRQPKARDLALIAETSDGPARKILESRVLPCAVEPCTGVDEGALAVAVPAHEGTSHAARVAAPSKKVCGYA